MGYNGLAAYLKNNYPFCDTPQNYGLLIVDKLTRKAKSITLYNLGEGICVNPSNALQFNFNELTEVKRSQYEGQCFLAAKCVDIINKRALPYITLNGK